MLEILKGDRVPELPVAFATNTLYVIERNNLGGAHLRETYEKLLVPLIKAKAEYLHAEGVAQTIWALSNAELVEDAQLWSTLKKLALSKDFSPVLVKSERYTAS